MRTPGKQDRRQASSSIVHGDYAGAFTLLKKIYPEHFDDFDCHVLRAEAAIHTKHWADADTVLISAERLSPGNSSVNWLKTLRAEMSK